MAYDATEKPLLKKLIATDPETKQKVIVGWLPAEQVREFKADLPWILAIH